MSAQPGQAAEPRTVGRFKTKSDITIIEMNIKKYFIIITVIVLLISILVIVIYSRTNISIPSFQFTSREIYEYKGIVEEKDNCIFMVINNSSEYTILWPKQFEVELGGESILVIDHYLVRQITWYFGDEIRIMGQILNNYEKENVIKVNNQCIGPYIKVNNFYNN